MTSISILLQTIFTAYFSNSRCLILINDGESLLELQPQIPLLIINDNFSQNFENLFHYIGCQDFVLNVKHPVSVFQDIEVEIKLHQDRFNKRRYVFVPTEEQKENPFDLSDSEGIQYVSDLLIISKEVNESFEPQNENRFWDTKNYIFKLWTHKYISLSDNNKFYLLDKWFSNNQSFLLNNNLFPDKLTNQERRILKTAEFSYEPYVVIEPNDNGTYSFMGSEMITLLTFAEHHNMTLVPVINELDYWGEIWENWTGNGLMGNLVEDKADVGAAALYTWESAYKFLDLSKPTVRSGITCLVPAPQLAAGWMTPVRVYTAYTWMAVIGTFVAILLILYLHGVLQLSRNDNLGTFQDTQRNNSKLKAKIFGKALISVSKPFVMQNVTEKEISKGLLGKYLMGLVFMTTLVLSTTYDSGLATIMTIPRYENPINTVDELVASGLYWGATQDAWIISIRDAKEPNLVKLVERFVATSEENLRKFSFTGEFGYSVERLPNGNHAVGSYIQREVIQNFHLMTEDIYWEMSVVMMRKNSILLPYIDIFILRVFEAGLISVWQNEATAQYMDQYVQKVVKYLSHHQLERGIVKLKIVHVQGAFGILVCGNGIAFAIFLTEILCNKLWQNVVLPH